MTEEIKGLGYIDGIVIDVSDLDRAEAFWAMVLGASVTYKDSNYVVYERQKEGAPQIGLQKATEVKATKNRMHIDIRVADVEIAVGKVVSAGGSEVWSHDSEGFVVVADPDGNEFCLVPIRK